MIIAKFVALPGTPEQVEVVVQKIADLQYYVFINGGVLSTNADYAVFESPLRALLFAEEEVVATIKGALE